jgi:hypothetical protein
MKEHYEKVVEILARKGSCSVTELSPDAGVAVEPLMSRARTAPGGGIS